MNNINPSSETASMNEPSMRTLPNLAETDFGEDPYLLSHVSRALRREWPRLLMLLLIVGLGYVLFTVLFFLAAPSERIATLPFRFEFQGASDGVYPNRTKFSVSDIV